MNATGAATLVIIVLAILAGLGWYGYRRREFGKLDDHVQHDVAAARDARKKHKAAVKQQARDIAAIERTVDELSSIKGRQITSGGGVTVYQRWIETKQGQGSIIGVTASAADESSVRQRLTATRMVTLGVFALAAPKKTGAGNAYVVIEGPSLSGVATFDGSKDHKAGPHAYELAAAINTQARQAADEKKTLPEKIQRAKDQLAATTADHEKKVEAAWSHFGSRLAALPVETRDKYFGKDRIDGAV